MWIRAFVSAEEVQEIFFPRDQNKALIKLNRIGRRLLWTRAGLCYIRNPGGKRIVPGLQRPVVNRPAPCAELGQPRRTIAD
jgi:hypothetical protein